MGHYADGGRGIVIGFGIQDENSITPDNLCIKVNYTNEVLILKDRIKPTLAVVVDENGPQLFFKRRHLMICF